MRGERLLRPFFLALWPLVDVWGVRSGRGVAYTRSRGSLAWYSATKSIKLNAGSPLKANKRNVTFKVCQLPLRSQVKMEKGA